MTEVVSSPVIAQEAKHQTQKDITLSRVIDFFYSSWLVEGHLGSSYDPYHSRKNELTVSNGCLMWGNHVVIT